jgi:hypothetical protein
VSAPCPSCGAYSVSTQRTCATCGTDLLEARRAALRSFAPPPAESFTERYRGTPWETPALPGPPATPIPGRQILLALVPFVGLAVVFVASRAHYLDMRLDYLVAGAALLSVAVFAGLVSRIVPGTKARGWFKSYLVAYFGTTLLNIALVILNSGRAVIVVPLPPTLSFVADMAVMETAGAILFRLILLLTEA